MAKTMFYLSKNPEKLKALLLEPTGISAVKVGGSTIYSGLGKAWTKWLGLNDKSKATLNKRLSEVTFLILN